MEYLYLIYLNEQQWNEMPAAERDRCAAQGNQMIARWQAQGKHRGGAPLHSAATATSIRLQDGQQIITDGPFAETHEQLAGYMLVEAESLDEAVALFTEGNSGSPGTIEVRAVAPFPQPAAAPTAGRKQYMLLCYHNEAEWEAAPESEKERLRRDGPVFAQELAAAGRWIAGAPLTAPRHARSLRFRDGRLLVTDGPFAETREHLAGYILFHADNLDEAIAAGKRFHARRAGTVEVRPIGVCEP